MKIQIGYALTVPHPLTASTTPDAEDRIESCGIATFIRNTRSVSSDPQVEQQQLDSLLAHAHRAADHFLDAYYHADGFSHNPFKLARKQTVTVQIDAILQISKQCCQVRWTETARDLNGVNLGGADALGRATTDATHPAKFRRGDRKQSARAFRDPNQLDAAGPVNNRREERRSGIPRSLW